MVGAASEGRRLPSGCGWFLALGAAVLAAGCAPTLSAASYTVVGKVSVGPQCGGPQREGQSCDVDYEGVEVRLLDEQGRTLAQVQTNAQGSFQLAGAAGRHTVRVISPKVVRCPDQWVELPQLGDTPLRLACDSGRR